MSFDQYMTSYYANKFFDAYGFEAPESEAYAFGWATKNVTPKPALSIDVCAMDKVTDATRAITKNSEITELHAAANQAFFANLPNFVNKTKDGLIVAMIFGDGTQHQYRHTSIYGLLPINGTYVPGSGTSRCPPAA